MCGSEGRPKARNWKSKFTCDVVVFTVEEELLVIDGLRKSIISQ